MIEGLIVLFLSAIAGALLCVARELHGLALRAPNATTFWVPPEAIDGIERAVERGLSKIVIPPATVNQVTYPDASRVPSRVAQHPQYMALGSSTFDGFMSTAPVVRGLETEIREAERAARSHALYASDDR